LLLLALLLLAPAGLAIAFALSEPHGDGPLFATNLFEYLLLPVLIPLTALAFGTSALGSEVEDRTLIYLTLRPIPRAAIVAAKLLAAAVLTLVLVEVATTIMFLIAIQRTGATTYPISHPTMLGAMLLAGLGASLAYTSLFLLLGLLAPKRALIIGFVYVLGWEGLAAGLSTALATMAIRRYVLGLLNARLSGSALSTILPSTIDGATATLVLVGVVLGAGALSTIRLQRMELP